MYSYGEENGIQRTKKTSVRM